MLNSCAEYVVAVIVCFVMSILGIYLFDGTGLYEDLWYIDIQYNMELKRTGIKEDGISLLTWRKNA